MAVLRSPSGQAIVLRAHHLVGRARSMHTQIVAPEVSAQHAVLTWRNAGWELRDLGSRNGTRVDGMACTPLTGPVRLQVGQVVCFGDHKHAFSVVNLAPPGVFAETVDGGETRMGEALHLALPEDDDPHVLVMLEPSEGWVQSTEAGQQPVHDGQVLDVRGTSWVLHLPESLPETIDASPGEPSGPSFGLQFRVSADEEHVEVTVSTGAQAWPVKPRVDQYALLTLARARIQDAERGVAEGEQGWLYTTDLAKGLRINLNRLYVMLHRGRKQIDAVLCGAGAVLIERRPMSKQVRIGTGTLEVSRL